MTDNGVGFITKETFSPVLIYKGKGAPWPNLFTKVEHCYKENYANWSYCREPVIYILYEGLIRWQDDQEV